MLTVFDNIKYFFIGIIMSICLAFDIPMHAIGRPLDLTGYELVWSDEFEGAALDTTKWSGHNHDLSGALSKAYDAENGHEACYYCSDNIKVQNGTLILSITHEDGTNPAKPAGWYAASLDTRESQLFTSGYFECRAKLCKAVAGNCAFWLTGDEVYLKTGGTEVDIMESMRYGVDHEGSVENNIHYFDANGHQRLHARWVIVDGNPYDEFHTYGCKWDASGYTFYVDGKECRQTDFGKNNKPEYIVLSNFMRDFKTQSIVGDSADYVVDYVRVYQQTP